MCVQFVSIEECWQYNEWIGRKGGYVFLWKKRPIELTFLDQRLTQFQKHTNSIVLFTAYYNGVVIVACKGCNSAHMIADNLGWYDYAGGFEGDNNIEEYFQTRGVGDAVTRVSKEVVELEDLLERTGTVGSNTDMLDSSDTTSMQ